MNRQVLKPLKNKLVHCVKSVQIRTFFWSIISRIRTRKNSVFGLFSSSSGIDLILTNRPTCFQLSTVLETGLSDFHLLTEFKMGFTKSKPRMITYRDYKKFNNNTFISEIQSLCSSEADLGFSKDSYLYILLYFSYFP